MKTTKSNAIALAAVSALFIASCGEPAVQLPESKPAEKSDAAAGAGTTQTASSEPRQLTDAELLAPLVANGDGCNVESIDFVNTGPNVSELDRKEAVVGGWLLPKSGAEDENTGRIRLTQLDGLKGWEVAVTQRASREDVVASLGGKPSDLPGFNQPIDFAKLQPGTYHMVVVYDVGGVGQVCDNGRQVNLK